jgi:hypothetical protein
MEYTTARQDPDERRRRLAMHLLLLLLALVALSFVRAAIWPDAATTAPVYNPDPTPVINQVHIFSHNCIGWTVSC